MRKERWNGQTWYMPLDQTRTNEKLYQRFRDQCLNSKMPKHWVDAEKEGNPDFSWLFFVKQKEFPAEFNIAEFFINRKGKRFWLLPSPPTEWAEIETYEYTYEDGTPVYDEFI